MRIPEANGAKVLVIEDNPLNMELVTHLLETAGYAVTQATDAEQGIRSARSVMPALVLMDLALPGMDGLRATQLLRQDPETRDLVIVALTAYAMKGDEERALAAGCQGYITKPIDIKTFLGQIAGYVGSADSLRQAA